MSTACYSKHECKQPNAAVDVSSFTHVHFCLMHSRNAVRETRSDGGYNARRRGVRRIRSPPIQVPQSACRPAAGHVSAELTLLTSVATLPSLPAMWLHRQLACYSKWRRISAVVQS